MRLPTTKMLKTLLSYAKKLYVPLSLIVIAFFLFQRFESDNMPATVNDVEKGLAQLTEYFPVSEGSFWEYKGIKKEQQVGGEIKTTEVSKRVTVTKIEQKDGVTYINLEDGEYPYITVSKGVIDFEPNKGQETKFALSFPLYVGKRWGDEKNLKQRNDSYYVWEVEEKLSKEVLGKAYDYCYRIAFKQLPDTEYKVFCYGIGIVEEGYKHNGTVMEWDYKLVLAGISGVPHSWVKWEGI